jgi:hypothetical protein
MSDPDEGEEKTKDDGEDKTRLEQGKVSLDDGKAQQEADSHLALQPSSDVLGRLKRENRCFKCQQVGHWMRDCPKRPLDSDQEKPQLQIANSGRPEVMDLHSILTAQTAIGLKPHSMLTKWNGCDDLR